MQSHNISHRRADWRAPRAQAPSYQQIIDEIVAVQQRDPLGRRSLLADIADEVRTELPDIAASIDGALRSIPANPGFTVEGGVANRAESLMLDAVQAGLQGPLVRQGQPDARTMMWRLLRLGKRNVDAHPSHPQNARESALLGWYLLQAVKPLTIDKRSTEIDEGSRRPTPFASYPHDLGAARANSAMIDEVFGKERGYEHRGHSPGMLGRHDGWLA